MAPPNEDAPAQEAAGAESYEIAFGVIQDAYSHTGVYVVALTGGGHRQVTRLGTDSDTPLGTREISQLTIGTGVICLLPDSKASGYIVGVASSQVFDPRVTLPEQLVVASTVGIMNEQLHYHSYQDEKNGLGNYSGGRPLDTLQGDWGHINDFGVAVWLGRIIAQMRASDVAKIEMFCGDDLVRLFGYNFDLFTAGVSRRCTDDEGEYNEVELWTPFMWESLGAYETGEEVFTDNSGAAGGVSERNEKSRFEPKQELQIIVPRGMNLRGYVGDVKREIITLLPPDGTGIATRDDEKKPRGVMEQHVGLDGGLHFRSAKEVVFEKSLMMPVPRQLLDPDDPEGDSGLEPKKNYRPAGYYGSGPEQEKKPFKFSGEQDKALSVGRAASLWEYQAYLFGKYGLQVIDDHEDDWEAAEEGDVKIDDEKTNKIDDEIFKGTGGEGLKFNFSQGLPDFGTVTVDQRKEHDVRYYQSRSFFHMTDDGSIIIEDGYGSQLVMSGGNVYVSCQGDIVNRPGRSFITWAPRDIISKAGWCNEMSAAEGDLRLKAENNLHMVAGDGTSGSILIENRAKAKPKKSEWAEKYGEEIVSTGIIIKAEESTVDIWSKRVFAGTTKDDVQGVVELNAGRGKMVIAGDTVGVEALSQYGVIVAPGRSKSSCPVATQLVLKTGGVASLLANLDMVGNLGVWQGCGGAGKIEADGDVKTRRDVGAKGSIYCANAMQASSMTSGNKHNTEGSGRAPDIESRVSDAISTAEDAKEPLYQSFEDDTLDDADEGAANAEVWKEIGFSFRTSKQYKAEDFKIYESRSQQLYRAYGIGKKWNEPVVKAPDGETDTRPHPGQDTWVKGDAYQYADPAAGKNIDYTTGVSKKREQQTEEGPELKTASMESEYVVTVQLPE